MSPGPRRGRAGAAGPGPALPAPAGPGAARRGPAIPSRPLPELRAWGRARREAPGAAGAGCPPPGVAPRAGPAGAGRWRRCPELGAPPAAGPGRGGLPGASGGRSLGGRGLAESWSRGLANSSLRASCGWLQKSPQCRLSLGLCCRCLWRGCARLLFFLPQPCSEVSAQLEVTNTRCVSVLNEPERGRWAAQVLFAHLLHCRCLGVFTGFWKGSQRPTEL